MKNNCRWDLTDFFKNEDECLLKLKEFEQLTTTIEKYNEKINNPRFICDFFEFEQLIEIISQKFTYYFSMLEHENYKNVKLSFLKKEYERIESKIDASINSVKKKIVDLDIKNLYKDYPKLKRYKNIIDECLLDLEENKINIKQENQIFDIYSALMNDINSKKANPLDFATTIANIWNSYFNVLSLEPTLLNELAFLHNCELDDINFMFKKIVSRKEINLDFDLINREAHFSKRIKIELPQAKKIIIDSLGVLGKQYNDIASQILFSKQIDYYPRENKVNCNATYTYSLLPSRCCINFKNNTYSTLVLAHELGHMVEHDIKYKRGVDHTTNFDMTAEFYSLFNELIVAENMFKCANTLDEKIECIYNILELYYENLIISSYNVLYFSNVFDGAKKGGLIDQTYLNNLLYTLNDQFNIDWPKDGWTDFELEKDLLSPLNYFFGIISASKAVNMLNTNTFDINEFMNIMESECDGIYALNTLGCNPYKSLDFTLNQYEKIMENSKDLLYEKEKILRRGKWK